MHAHFFSPSFYFYLLYFYPLLLLPSLNHNEDTTGSSIYDWEQLTSQKEFLIISLLREGPYQESRYYYCYLGFLNVAIV